MEPQDLYMTITKISPVITSEFQKRGKRMSMKAYSKTLHLKSLQIWQKQKLKTYSGS